MRCSIPFFPTRSQVRCGPLRNPHSANYETDISETEYRISIKLEVQSDGDDEPEPRTSFSCLMRVHFSENAAAHLRHQR